MSLQHTMDVPPSPPPPPSSSTDSPARQVSNSSMLSCWICLDNATDDDPLIRNPGQCTCTDGGWIHSSCLVELSQRYEPRSRIGFDSHAVQLMHEHSCKKMIVLARFSRPSHYEFLHFLCTQLLGTAMDMRNTHGFCLVIPAFLAVSAIVCQLVAYSALSGLVLFVVLTLPIQPIECDGMYRNKWVILAMLCAQIFLWPLPIPCASLLIRRWMSKTFWIWLEKCAQDELGADS